MIIFFRRRSGNRVAALYDMAGRRRRLIFFCDCVEEATANFLCRVEPVKIKISSPDGEIEGCVVVHRITCRELAGDGIFRFWP